MKRFLAAFLFCLSTVPFALAIDVQNGCLEEESGKNIILLDLSCPSADKCWSDIDALTFAAVASGKEIRWAANALVWLDKNGKVMNGPPSEYPAHAIWDFSGIEETNLSEIHLESGDTPVTDNIVLKNSCKHIPAAVLEELGLK